MVPGCLPVRFLNIEPKYLGQHFWSRWKPEVSTYSALKFHEISNLLPAQLQWFLLIPSLKKKRSTSDQATLVRWHSLRTPKLLAEGIRTSGWRWKRFIKTGKKICTNQPFRTKKCTCGFDKNSQTKKKEKTNGGRFDALRVDQQQKLRRVSDLYISLETVGSVALCINPWRLTDIFFF